MTDGTTPPTNEAFFAFVDMLRARTGPAPLDE